MINNLNLQRLQTAAGYSPMAKDTYTTLPEKVMEYLESTMETFILTVWFVWNSFAPPETGIVTLTCSALSEKGNLQCPKFKIYNRLCGCVSFFLHFSNFPQLPVYPSLHCESKKFCVLTIIRYLYHSNPSHVADIFRILKMATFAKVCHEFVDLSKHPCVCIPLCIISVSW